MRSKIDFQEESFQKFFNKGLTRIKTNHYDDRTRRDTKITKRTN